MSTKTPKLLRDIAKLLVSIAEEIEEAGGSVKALGAIAENVNPKQGLKPKEEALPAAYAHPITVPKLLSGRVRWTDEMEALLIKLWGRVGVDDLAAKFNCTPTAIRVKANKLRSKGKHVSYVSKKSEEKAETKTARQKAVVKKNDQLGEEKVFVKPFGDEGPKNATKWNEKTKVLMPDGREINAILHTLKRGNQFYGPPINHPDFSAWLLKKVEYLGKMGVKPSEMNEQYYTEYLKLL